MKEEIVENISFKTLQKQALKKYIKLDEYIEIIKYLNDYRRGKKIDEEQKTRFKDNYTRYYDMRVRPEGWRNNFYDYLETLAKKKECNKQALLKDIITKLSSFSEDKEQFEFSFATKLLSTIYPDEPTIDRNVLKKFEKEINENKEKELITKVGRKKIYYTIKGADFQKKIENAIEVFNKVKEIEKEMVENKKIKKEIKKFREYFKKELDNIEVTDMKILDFFLWKQEINLEK